MHIDLLLVQVRSYNDPARIVGSLDHVDEFVESHAVKWGAADDPVTLLQRKEAVIGIEDFFLSVGATIWLLDEVVAHLDAVVSVVNVTIYDGVEPRLKATAQLLTFDQSFIINLLFYKIIDC